MGRICCRLLIAIAVVIPVCFTTALLRAESIFSDKPDDPGAIVLAADQFPVKGDGVADDSDGLQQAADRARAGILLIPEGRYRLTRTIYVAIGTRVIGYG